MSCFFRSLRTGHKAVRALLLVCPTLLLAACGSGGSSNRAPTASAGADQTVSELTLVSLNGSGSDADGDTLSYSWSQTPGATVTLNNANSSQASFTAPDVAAGIPESLTFRLTVSDGTANTTDTVDITVQEPSPLQMVFGTVNYEFVPPANVCRGLDFDNTIVRPIRGATVQLIDDATGNVLDVTVSDDAGNYSFGDVESNKVVRLRVRAELKKTTGASRWNVEVRDNVDDAQNSRPLNQRALYTVDGAAFDTSTSDVTRDLTATTGWTGSSYGDPRAAAPFAILDAIYTATKFVESVDGGAIFPPLDAFWSERNTTNFTGDPDLDAGKFGASFFSMDPENDFVENPSLFLLGDASDDTEEFDDHVIVHEWGHYFEDNFSRSDSFGGAHTIGDRLDPRLAFGEGWATALAGMALDNQLYCDTSVPGTAGGFGIGAESDSYDARGWYDEISVVRFIYDMFDDTDEGNDSVALGFAPIYAVMTGPQATTEAFTTVFSFATALRGGLSSADQLGLDAQLAREDMTAAGLDVWGTNELNLAGGAPDVAPIYQDMTADGSTLNICANSQFDSDRDGNKLSEYRYLRINVPMSARYDVTVTTTTALPDDPDDPDDQSDPDIFMYRNGTLVAIGGSGVDNEEAFRTQTLAGPDTYVAALREYRFEDENTPAAFPSRVCFDVALTPVP